MVLGRETASSRDPNRRIAPFAPGAGTAAGSAPGATLARTQRSGAGTFFQPRQTQPSNKKVGKKKQRKLDRQQDIFGPASAFLPEGLTRGDLPGLEFGLNFENILKAEQDRSQAVSGLEQARLGIGTSPESLLAKEEATKRLQSGGPFTEDLIAQRSLAFQDNQTRAVEAAQAQAASELARRGVSGGLLARDNAILQQQAAATAQQQISEFQTQAALANEQSQAQALGQLESIAAREEQEQLAISQLLADIFANTQRAPIDLSGLVEPVKRRNQLV